MNKEDKLKIVERSIKGTKEYIEEIKENLKNGILHNKEHRKWLKTLLERQEYQLEVFKRELKLLQIQPRTIDNLQVGDYIEFDYIEFDYINGNKLIRHYKGVVTELGDELFYILNCYNGFYYDQIHYGLQEPIIIPYEFLELWGEINDNI